MLIYKVIRHDWSIYCPRHVYDIIRQAGVVSTNLFMSHPAMEAMVNFEFPYIVPICSHGVLRISSNDLEEFVFPRFSKAGKLNRLRNLGARAALNFHELIMASWASLLVALMLRSGAFHMAPKGVPQNSYRWLVYLFISSKIPTKKTRMTGGIPIWKETPKIYSNIIIAWSATTGSSAQPRECAASPGLEQTWGTTCANNGEKP